MLTPKQERFCQEYILDLNATQAAIRAGYAKGSAEVTGCRLLTNAKVSAFIQQLQKKTAEKLEITHEWITKRFKDISDRCMKEGLSFDPNGANKATENLAKHIGFFEKDNRQKAVQVFNVADTDEEPG